MRGILLHAPTERRRHPGLFDPLRTDTYALAEQVATIAARAHVISLEEVLDHFVEGRPFAPRSVHLSIDGEYLDTLVAAELLERHQLPWTLFVPVGAVIDRHPSWYVRLADAISVSRNVLDAHGTLHDLSYLDGKQRFFTLAMADVRAAAGNEEETTRCILDLPGMSQPDESHWPTLEVEHVRALAAGGVVVGSHAISDVDLTGLATQRLEVEVGTSRQRLAAAIERPVGFFAYPHGDHDRRVRGVVQRHYELAVGGLRPGFGDRRYRLTRHDAGHDRAGVDIALGDVNGAPPAVSRALRHLIDRGMSHPLVVPNETPRAPAGGGR